MKSEEREADGASATITLTERGGAERVVTARSGETLAAALRRAGIPVDYDCGGRGKCGRCALPILGVDGTRSTRLACQTPASSAVRVDVSGLRGETTGPESPDLAPIDRTRPDAFVAGDSAGRFGLAVDVGTTTLAAALVALDSGRVIGTLSARNPQVAYGRDVLARVAASAGDGASTMRRLVCEAIGALASTLSAQAGVMTTRITEIVAAGNTVMEFLLTGRDPGPLGEAPFVVGERRFASEPASAYPWDAEFAPTARVRVFPVFSAFVGGDIVAGFARLRRLGAFDGTGSRLFLDVGTNGESILAHNGRYYATSTAAGPAFEGSEISQGSVASPGAIAGVAYDAPTFAWTPRVVGGVPATRVCGSGLVAALAGGLEFGAIAPSGRIASGAEYTAKGGDPGVAARLRTSGRDRAFLISSPSELEETGGVWLTQRDVRQAQLAIAATKAGRRLLLAAAGADATSLETLYLAGAFGASLDVTAARRVGLTPRVPGADRVVSCGNTSLLGAVDVLTGAMEWETLPALLDLVEHVDLAGRADFADVFAEAARFPENFS